MKKILYFFSVILVLGSMVISCKSKEEKAEALIKDYMFKTLYDFDSYQVVETTIDSALVSPYYDEEIIKEARVAALGSKEYYKKLDEGNSAIRSMTIWGDSWTSYGRSNFNEAKDKATKALKEASLSSIVIYETMKKIRGMIDDLDEGAFMGWKATHKFRCKTKGGNSELATYIFICDKDFKSILYTEDPDDEDVKSSKDIIEQTIDLTIEDLDKNIEEAKAHYQSFNSM